MSPPGPRASRSIQPVWREGSPGMRASTHGRPSSSTARRKGSTTLSVPSGVSRPSGATRPASGEGLTRASVSRTRVAQRVVATGAPRPRGGGTAKPGRGGSGIPPIAGGGAGSRGEEEIDETAVTTTPRQPAAIAHQRTANTRPARFSTVGGPDQPANEGARSAAVARASKAAALRRKASPPATAG